MNKQETIKQLMCLIIDRESFLIDGEDPTYNQEFLKDIKALKNAIHLINELSNRCYHLDEENQALFESVKCKDRSKIARMYVELKERYNILRGDNND